MGQGDRLLEIHAVADGGVHTTVNDRAQWVEVKVSARWASPEWCLSPWPYGHGYQKLRPIRAGLSVAIQRSAIAQGDLACEASIITSETGGLARRF